MSARGLSLVELLVALAIGSLLVVAAVTLYANGYRSYALNEAAARLQEQGRFVLSVLEPDIELAGYYAFTNRAESMQFVRGGRLHLIVAGAAQLRQLPPPPALPVPLAAIAASAHVCGVNFAVDVTLPVQGSNDAFRLGPAAAAGCAPSGGAQPGADTLTIRRASIEPARAPAPGRVQIYASRLRSHGPPLLFADGLAPGPLDGDHRIHDLVVRTYYVARSSVGQASRPALRMKSLTTVSGTPAFRDTEVMPGVEDLQVQFGIDTGDYDDDGIIDAGADPDLDGIPEADGRVTRYVDPDFPDLARFQVVAVRIWVRMVAEQPEPGFEDGRLYEYANVRYRPTGAAARYRHVLMSRTIALRNARTL
ncbi:MAG: PilW family protein [Gammaproteobacteria bacterium]|nr:PilW family protein [Gammaproteobacteria bacterium]